MHFLLNGMLFQGCFLRLNDNLSIYCFDANEWLTMIKDGKIQCKAQPRWMNWIKRCQGMFIRQLIRSER